MYFEYLMEMCNFAKTKFEVSVIYVYGNRNKIYGS